MTDKELTQLDLARLEDEAHGFSFKTKPSLS